MKRSTKVRRQLGHKYTYQNYESKRPSTSLRLYSTEKRANLNYLMNGDMRKLSLAPGDMDDENTIVNDG